MPNCDALEVGFRFDDATPRHDDIPAQLRDEKYGVTRLGSNAWIVRRDIERPVGVAHQAIGVQKQPPSVCDHVAEELRPRSFE